jgi:hypothetical protein
MRFSAVLLAITLAGCVAQKVTLSTTFNPAEAEYINAKGKAQVAGQLFLRRNDGVVVYGAGSEVRLYPATSYARERMTIIYGARKMSSGTRPVEFSDENPDYRRLSRVAKANGEGRFVFADVAPEGTM